MRLISRVPLIAFLSVIIVLTNVRPLSFRTHPHGQHIKHFRRVLNEPFSESPDYGCLFDWHETLSIQQVQWRTKKQPGLASIMPAMPMNSTGYVDYVTDYTHITVVFSMYKIKYDRWYDHSSWFCAMEGGFTVPSQMNIRDRKTLVMGVKVDGGLFMTIDCPRETLEVHVHKYKNSNVTIVYDLRQGKSCSMWRQPKGYLSACAIIRGESSRNQVAEWVAYHSLVGVEHFYVYLNERILPSSSYLANDTWHSQYNGKDRHNKTVTLKDLQNRLPPSLVTRVHFIPYGFVLWQQGASQIECTMRANHSMAWVLQIDVDEYMQVMDPYYFHSRNRSSRPLADFLRKKEQESIQREDIDYRFSGLQTCNWLFHGTSRQIHSFDRSNSSHKMFAVEHFPQRESRCNPRRSQKMIVRPAYTQLYVHHWVYAGTSQYYCGGCQQYLNWVMNPFTEARTSHYKYPLIGLSKKDKHLVGDSSMAAYSFAMHELFMQRQSSRV